MADRFRDFAHLSAETRAGIDYRIRSEDRGTGIVFIAPHGGYIEPGTAEIAIALAGCEYSVYLFEALKPGVHGDFHITSHRFDEPQALDLLKRSRTAIAIHGSRDDGTGIIGLGGRAIHLRDAIGLSLKSAGFLAEPDKRLPGTHESNICNRAGSTRGVQLEIPRALRRRLVSRSDGLDVFCTAVRRALPAAPETERDP